jgi:hypothetical protein
MDASNALIYSYAHTDLNEEDNGTADPADADDKRDFKGFRLKDKVIEVQLGLNNWQALTDLEVVEIDQFDAEEVRAPDIRLPTCDTPSACASVGPCGGFQRLVTRYVRIKMAGKARHDPQVTRQLETRVRVRNDEVCL